VMRNEVSVYILSKIQLEAREESTSRLIPFFPFSVTLFVRIRQVGLTTLFLLKGTAHFLSLPLLKNTDERTISMPRPTLLPASLTSQAEIPLVRVEHLTRVIATGAQRTVILDDVTFNVSAGSLFAIIGPSGSGKSTLLNLLTGIDRPTEGRVIFAGSELRARSENALARWRGQHVGIIFQFFQLIPTLTALENVLLALELGGGGAFARSSQPSQLSWS